MMTAIYFLAHHFPFWGFPMALVLFELANAQRKRGHFGPMFMFGTMAFVLFSMTGVFFFYNGFDTIIPAIKRLERRYLD